MGGGGGGDMSNNDESKQTHLIFTYGTLKRGFPNHHLMQDLINQNAAVFQGTYVTTQHYPLVCGPHNIPYLINLPGSGRRVKGELYSVSTTQGGLARLDELEGISFGHYDRLPVQIQSEGDRRNGAVLVEAEAYFANRSFGESLWEKKGKVGINEYSDNNGRDYLRVDERAKSACILHDIASFLSI